MVVNSPQQRHISWERWQCGGPLKFPWSNVFLQPKKENHTRRFWSLPSLPSRGSNFYRPSQLGFKKLSKRFLSFWTFIRSNKNQHTNYKTSNGNWKGSRLFNSWSWIMFDHFDTLWNWSLLSPSLKGDKVNCHGIMVLKVVDVGGSVYESLSY